MGERVKMKDKHWHATKTDTDGRASKIKRKERKPAGAAFLCKLVTEITPTQIVLEDKNTYNKDQQSRKTSKVS